MRSIFNKNRNPPSVPIRGTQVTLPNPLGIDSTKLGKIKPSDLASKSTAKIVLSYNASLEVKVAELETQNQTLTTYANFYENSKLKSRLGAIFTFVATILIAYGINLISSVNPEMTYKTQQTQAGYIFTVAGIIMQVIAYFVTLL